MRPINWQNAMNVASFTIILLIFSIVVSIFIYRERFGESNLRPVFLCFILGLIIGALVSFLGAESIWSLVRLK